MVGRIEQGPTLMPGEPRYERLREAFASGILDPLKGAPIHAFANLLPMLKAERVAFRKSLEEQGQHHAVVFFKGLLLDGRNRARELIELGRPISAGLFVGTNREALDFVDAENFQRRHLDESQRADYAARYAMLKVGDNQHTRQGPAQICAPTLFENSPEAVAPVATPAGVVDRGETGEASGPDVRPDAAPASEDEAPQPVLSQTEAAERFNVSRRSVQMAVSVQQKGIPELAEQVQAGELAVSVAAKIAERPIAEHKAVLDSLPRDETGKLTAEAKKEIRKVAKEVRAEDQAEKKKKRDAKEKELADKILALPDVKAGLILSDFEWHFKVRSEATGMDRHAANHYVTASECNSPEEIVERQKERMSIAADDCIHLMWVPACFSAIGHKVMELQGFTYVSQFAWIKPGLGTGFWVRDCHELLFIGVKGKIPAPSMGEQFKSALDAPKGEHSAKPDFQYEIAEKYFPNLPKVELNARRARIGWIQWGNQLPDEPSLDLAVAARSGVDTSTGAPSSSSPAGAPDEEQAA